MGSITLPELLAQAEGDDVVGKMKVLAVLESLPGVGKVRPVASWRRSASARPVGSAGLGAQQREALLAHPSCRLPSPDLIIVISGPGGVGKGTLVAELLRREPDLWLSRSWTTRARRPGEHGRLRLRRPRRVRGAHRSRRLPRVDRVPRQLLRHADSRTAAGRRRRARDRRARAQQVRALHPDALLIFVMPPSREEQERRLRARATPRTRWRSGLAKAEEEEPIGLALADHVVVNDESTARSPSCRPSIASHQQAP